MLMLPEGVRLFAHECAAIWPVDMREYMLYYPDMKCPVPYSAEVIIEHTEGKYVLADRLAAILREEGWNNITIVETQIVHEHGEPVG